MDQTTLMIVRAGLVSNPPRDLWELGIPSGDSSGRQFLLDGSDPQLIGSS